MSQMKGTSLEGDLAIGRNITAGGDLTTRGNATIKKNLKVEGWLDARNIKTPCKGLFREDSILKSEYPRPREGWYALVGSGLPAEIYIARHGEWIATGEKTGDKMVIEGEQYNAFLQELDRKIEEIREKVNANEGGISSIKSKITEIDEKLELNDTNLDELRRDIINIGILPFDGMYVHSSSEAQVQPERGVWYVQYGGYGCFEFYDSDVTKAKKIQYNEVSVGDTEADGREGEARTDKIFRLRNKLYRYTGEVLEEYSFGGGSEDGGCIINVTREVPLASGEYYEEPSNEVQSVNDVLQALFSLGRSKRGMIMTFATGPLTWKVYQYVGEDTNYVNIHNADNWIKIATHRDLVDEQCGAIASSKIDILFS